MKLSPDQLFKLLWCWQTKKSLEATRLLAKVSYPTVSRWFSRFRDKLYHITIYMRILDTLSTPLLEGLVLGRLNSYFAKLKSKQATYIVTGAIEPSTGHKVK